MERATELLGLFPGVLEDRILGLLVVPCCAVEGGEWGEQRSSDPLKKLSDGACE